MRMISSHAAVPRAQAASRLDSRRYDWAVVAGSAWLLGGTLLDGWAHHNVASTLESPFTPWHAVLYSGFAALAAVLVWPLVRDRRAGLAAVPPGYVPSVVGVGLFALGGPADITWHALFGIEVSVRALLSPTHLLLFLGAMLMFSGPARAAWRSGPDGGTAPLTALISLTFTASVLQILTVEFANVFTTPWPVGAFDMPAADRTVGLGITNTASLPAEIGQVIGVAGILLQALALSGVILLALRRWRLPLGAVTLLYTVIFGSTALMHDQVRLLPAALLAGLAADLIIRAARPSVDRPDAVRITAFAIPVLLFGGYFLTLALTNRVAWPVEVWSGSILLAGGLGLLTSYLAVPWRTPGSETG